MHWLLLLSVGIYRAGRGLNGFKVSCNFFGTIPVVDSTNGITQGVFSYYYYYYYYYYCYYYYYWLQLVVYLLLITWFVLSVVAYSFRLLIPSILHRAFWYYPQMRVISWFLYICYFISFCIRLMLNTLGKIIIILLLLLLLLLFKKFALFNDWLDTDVAAE